MVFYPPPINNERMKPARIIDGEELLSQVIAFLRFPLIVGVVLIHSRISIVNGVEGDLTVTHPFDGAFPFYESAMYIFARIFARICVPLFFMFSGYLFFYKSEGFTLKDYGGKLKRRIFTLLIPYLVWNALYIVFYDGAGLLFPGSTKYFIGEGYGVKDWLMAFWNWKYENYPVSYQLWFLRTLMVVSVFSPVIYWFTKRLDWLFPAILGLLWMMDWWFDAAGFEIEAFFFFAAGAYFSVTKRNFVDLVKPHARLLGVLYAVFMAAIFVCRDHDWGIYVRNAGVLIGVAFVTALSAVNISKGRWRVNDLLTRSSFFIYAYHVIALPIIRRVLFFFVPCTTEARATMLFFVSAAIAVGVGLGLYRLLSKRMPKTTAFVTGGRLRLAGRMNLRLPHDTHPPMTVGPVGNG